MAKQHHQNPILGLINSWILNILSDYMHYLFGDAKRKLLKDHPQTVIEIGSGAGANMRYLRRGTKLIAIEPNVYMHINLKKNAAKYGINLEIRSIKGEAIDLPDNSADFIISTLVLCTVDDPYNCIEQLYRILKPSGTFVFIEHVKAKDNSILSGIQTLLHKPWHWFFEGCHTNRDIISYLEFSSFSKLEIERYNLYSLFIPMIPQIRGKAIK